MAKSKADGPRKVPHPHLHARLAFLQQAAQLLEEQQHSRQSVEQPQPHAQDERDGEEGSDKVTSHKLDSSRGFQFKSNVLARELSSQTTAITRKTKIRIAPGLKRTICKGCSSKLVEGQSSSSRTENKSRVGRKAWADVLIVTCLSCKMEKRYPVGQSRGTKKAQRKAKSVSKESEQVSGEG